RAKREHRRGRREEDEAEPRHVERAKDLARGDIEAERQMDEAANAKERDDERREREEREIAPAPRDELAPDARDRAATNDHGTIFARVARQLTGVERVDRLLRVGEAL